MIPIEKFVFGNDLGKSGNVFVVTFPLNVVVAIHVRTEVHKEYLRGNVSRRRGKVCPDGGLEGLNDLSYRGVDLILIFQRLIIVCALATGPESQHLIVQGAIHNLLLLEQSDYSENVEKC